MSYGPPPGNQPGQPSGGYGPPQGGQPGEYGQPTQHGSAAPGGQYGAPQPGPQGGQYGPPPGGQYGAPQGSQYAPYGGAPAKSGFDPKSVNPLDWGQLAAGLIALIFSFFSYYQYKPKGADAKQTCSNISSAPASVRGELQDACDGITNSAWHGFFGWFGVLLAVLGAILIALALFAPTVKLPVPTRLAAAALFVLAALSTLIALFVVPDGDYKGQTIDSGSSDTDAGHSFSYWIVLIVIVVGAVLAIMRFLQTGGNFSDLMGNKGSSGVSYGQPGHGGPGHHSAQQQSDYGQQPGYQPSAGGQPGFPPQQQYTPAPPPSAPQSPPGGYQPPAAPAPQPGYQPPPQQGPPPGYQPPPQQGPPPGYQPPPGQPGGEPGQQPPA